MTLNKIIIKSPTEIIIDQKLSTEINVTLKSEDERSKEKRYALVKTKSNKLLLNKLNF